MMREGGTDASAHGSRYGFRLLTGRAPDDRRSSRLLEKLYADERAAFARDPRAAARGCSPSGEAPRDARASAPAETAALAVVASTLMNLDEAVIKR